MQVYYFASTTVHIFVIIYLLNLHEDEVRLALCHKFRSD